VLIQDWSWRTWQGEAIALNIFEMVTA
jgi:hypothetical protein